MLLLNLSRVFLHILKIELKYSFNSKLAFFGYALGILINLIVYYFTSKAVVFNQVSNGSLFQHGYFEYILIGEIVLLLTQASLTQGQDLVIRLKNNGLLEQLHYSKLNVIRGLIIYYFAIMIINSIHILLALIFSMVFFKISLSPLIIFQFAILIVVTSILFSGIYFLNVSITLIFKRRNNSLQHLVNLLGFFSGAYFPLEVIGSKTAVNFLQLSPLTSLVNWARGVIYENTWITMNLYTLVFWFIAPAFLAYLIYFFRIKNKNGYFYVNQ